VNGGKAIQRDLHEIITSVGGASAAMQGKDLLDANALKKQLIFRFKFLIKHYA